VSRNKNGGIKMGNQHVVPRDDGWAVKGEGNKRDTSRHNTQKEAIDAARDIAINREVRSLFTVVMERYGIRTVMAMIRVPQEIESTDEES
jgi:hypothetical protein